MRDLKKSNLIALLLALFLVAAVAGCGGGEDTTSTTRVVDEEPETTEAEAAGECEDVEQPEPKQIALEAPEPGQVLEEGQEAAAIVETSCGSFTITLDTVRAPLTSNSFAFMAQEGVFDDLPFHRVVPDFVIQTGDTDGSGNGGPGYQIEETPPADLEYVRGVVAMAKTEIEPPGTSGSQFFVVTAPGTPLPPDYALLGEVTEGMEVVDLISSYGDPATQAAPTIPIIIRSVTIETAD